MNITKNAEGSKLLLALDGRLDTTTAPELEAEIGALINDVDELTLDFGSLEYISSAGLRVLLSTQKAMNKKGCMKLVNVNADIMDIFEITGFDSILTIE